MTKNKKFIIKSRDRWRKNLRSIEKRACTEQGGIICDNCDEGWVPGYCKVVRYRFYIHRIDKKEAIKEAKKGNSRYVMHAAKLYAPWKLGMLEKLLVLL